MADSDDEPITLSSHALEALKEFYADRDARAQQFEQLKAAAEENAAARPGDAATADAAGESAGGEAPTLKSASSSKLRYPLSMEVFTEDWNESQFWYSDETATLLAKHLLADATAETRIAVVSAPSVFVALKNLLASQPPEAPTPQLFLLEHDNRFAVFSEFIFYDFMAPVKLPAHLKSSIDRLIVDPPFLSEDCQTKAALTVRWMAKIPPPPPPSFSSSSTTTPPTSTSSPPPNNNNTTTTGATTTTTTPKLIACTGERMENLVVDKLYKSFGLRTTTYEPVHARGLSNEFFSYANFECEDWTWRKGPG